ncbi:class I adenylate-forming enzyme family protein [Alicyclobacillus macrosporangiidus]|uniref:Cyclohexanecarboxylate-CoA ligase/acyl-CoA synthetase n=1 Tax=Alicyclobacillus macrosporangiidus TaxID=392015 RepID=A0A1I7GUN0_9BACL|nr:AMP-binding protein [Alicyclobacillus macrosporangiidus]SFU52121.1 cyclohexanecarboxylate-CoA ligase/acyl-CoA synthetase [Alicyclobacillus macrosporangiidus]
MQRFPGMVLTPERAQAYLDQGIWRQEAFPDVLERQAELQPDLVHRDDRRRATQVQLWQEAESVAAGLRALGVGKGDVVALQMGSSLDYLVALWGITRIGAVAALLQADLGREALRQSLLQAGASVWLVAATHLGQPLAETAVALRRELPDLQHVVVSAEDPAAVPAGCASFAALRDAGGRLGEEAQALRPGPLDPFIMVFSAGTTGAPRGIVHLHANYLWAVRTYAELFGLRPGDGMLTLAPVYHQTGMLLGVVMPLVSGGRVLLMDRFSAARALRWVAEERPRFLVGAPPHLVHVAQAPGLRDADISSVAMFFYAGAPVSNDILRQLQQDTGWKVGALFGWSEGLLACATRPDDPIEAASTTVGRVIPGIEVVLVDEDGRPVQPGEVGEMWSRGPSFCAGYYRQPEVAAERWDAQGWFHSGDLFRQDAEGRFVYCGRADDIINRGGTKIDPKVVESALLQHPAVVEAGVVGIPDRVLGRRTVACVVTREGASLSLAELRDFLANQGLAKYELPDGLRLFEALPKTAAGTVKRRELSAWCERGDGDEPEPAV